MSGRSHDSESSSPATAGAPDNHEGGPTPASGQSVFAGGSELPAEADAGAGGAPAEVVLPPWWVGYDTLLAVAAFVVLYRYGGGLVPAIGAITVASVLSGFLRVRHGIGVGKLLPLVTVAVIVRGVVGIVTGSDDVYFGIGIGYKYAIAAALVLSVPFKRNPAEPLLARTLGLNAAIRAHRAYLTAVDHIVVAFGLLLALAATFDIWLLSVTDPDAYLLIRYIINWPLYVGVTTAGLVYLARRLAGIPGFPGVMALLEEQAELRAAARRRRR